MTICANCGHSIAPYDATGESAIYAPDRTFTLCEPCFLEEDRAIDREGTNVLPGRRAHYERTLTTGRRA